MNLSRSLLAIALAGLLCFLSACDGALLGGSSASLPVVWVSPNDGKEMILVPAGEFVMGTDKTDPEKTHLKIGTVKPLYLDQQPERRLHLDAFYIDRFEVTNREYDKFVRATKFSEVPTHWKDRVVPAGLEDHPVTNITWREALSFALWAGKTLPTESQWEKAARGTEGRLYPWGNDYQKGMANLDVDGAKDSAPVGSFPKDVSPYGVFDMAGNVMEWTLDWYLPYPGNTYNHSKFGGRFKVLRGNAFKKGGHYFLDAYRYAFYRSEVDPDDYFENVGFRCVMPVARATPGGNESRS